MKLFQQLLLAPAALGLLAPVAATAAEVNINDVASYARKPVSQMRAAKASQFSDVVPGDWAYTALQNLSESYGCVDNSYTQNLKSGQALTRYEAAALVNSCLGSGLASAGDSSDAIRLTNEFGTEMAILKGRVDGLEYKAQELSAGQFSAATKLENSVVFNTGYVEDDRLQATNTASGVDPNRLNMTYTFTSELNTSFSGSDTLYTKLETGNGNANDPFHSNPAMLADSNTNANALQVAELWYSNTFGDGFRYWVGPRIMSEMMLASSPTNYSSILEGFENGGNGSAYGQADGAGAVPGFGIAWSQQSDDSSGFEVSSNYVSIGGQTATTGILTEGAAKWLTKVGYGSDNWSVSLGMAKNFCNDTTPGTAGDRETCPNFGAAYATAGAGVITGNQTSWAARANWSPDDSGFIPSIQVGYDWSNVDDAGTAGIPASAGTVATAGDVEATKSWMIGLTWDDAFIDGNKAGFAFGVPEHVTDYVENAAVSGPWNDPANKAFAWEAYYDYKVNDGVTITPAIFKFNNRTNGNAAANDGFGGLIKTTFKF